MERYRPILFILFWGLILEIIVFIYFIVQRRFPFEFYLNLIVMVITIVGIIGIIRSIIRGIERDKK